MGVIISAWYDLSNGSFHRGASGLRSQEPLTLPSPARGEGIVGQGRAVRVTPSTLVSVAETDPMSTLAFMSTGMRAASLVTHTRILPSFRKSPLNRITATIPLVAHT